MKYQLKNYQRNVVDELKEYFNLSFKKDGKIIVFQSPTGSGKTFMATALFEELVEENADEKFCIVWCSIGKGELHKQSYLNVKEYLGGNPICSLLDDEFFGSRGYIKDHEIVFVNWEKLVDKDKESGKWINNLMKDKEGMNFIDVIDNTKKRGTKIILVVDESHIGSKSNTRISEFKDTILIPSITLEMSATPIITDQDFKVKVNPQDVIDEGMMKEEIVINEGIKEISDVEIDSEILILEKAFNKRLEIIEEYKKLNVDVNPLVLIQIPNKDAGEDKKLTIKDFLLTKGITVDSGELGFWCDNNSTIDKVKIKEKNNKVSFLVFKTAIATGWDCPRAHILVKFREGQSEVFEIQTVGRILRTVEAKKYSNDILDKGYVFTNVKGIETRRDTYSPNIIKTEWSYFRTDERKQPIYSPLHIKSFYRSRQEDYNSADSRFSEYFEKEFMSYFDLEESDKYVIPNIERLTNKGLKLEKLGSDRILNETTLDSAEIDKEKKYDTSTSVVKMSNADVNNAYYTLISQHLSGLAYIRSKSSVNVAIVDQFTQFLNIFSRAEKLLSIQKVVLENIELFSSLLDKATSKFRTMLEDSKGKKGMSYDFEIADKRAYSNETHKRRISSLSLYEPFYVFVNENGKTNQLEESFMKYLEENSHLISWYWQNSTEIMKTNFGISYNGGLSTFQPDFIVKYKDGTIGIYDTKGIDYNVEDTKLKAEALFKYLSDTNQNRNEHYGKVIGGIVVQNKDVFYVYNEFVYEDYKVNPDKYKLFSEILSQIDINLDIKNYNKK